MSSTGTVVQESSALLVEAIRRGTDVTISLRTTDGWRTRRSRMVGHDEEQRHIVLAPLWPDSTPMVELTPGMLMGINYRRGHKKCMFSTRFAEFREYATGDRSYPGALWLQWPERVQQLQRRVYYRATPPSNRQIPVRIILPAPGDAPSFRSCDARQKGQGKAPAIEGRIQDLSAGGIRLLTSYNGTLGLDQQAVIQFTPQESGELFTLDATYRHGQPMAGNIQSLGFQFVGLETTPVGQATLFRLASVVTEYHRAGRKRFTPSRPR